MGKSYRYTDKFKSKVVKFRNGTKIRRMKEVKKSLGKFTETSEGVALVVEPEAEEKEDVPNDYDQTG